MSDKRKLYTIVGSGFSSNIKRALISFLYPLDIKKEAAETEIPEIVSGVLFDASFINEAEQITMSIPTIVSGELRELVLTVNVTEQAELSIPEIVSGMLRDALFYTEETEPVELAIPIVQSGNLMDPVFYTEATEPVTLSIPTIVSGSLV